MCIRDRRYPTSRIIIFADNDKNGTGEQKARECITANVANGGRVPVKIGFDWYNVMFERKPFKIGATKNEYKYL